MKKIYSLTLMLFAFIFVFGQDEDWYTVNKNDGWIISVSNDAEINFDNDDDELTSGNL